MECTKEEREFLDALTAYPMSDPSEMMTRLAIGRLSPELIARLVSTTSELMLAERRSRAAWREANELGVYGKTSAFGVFYERIQREAAELVSKDTGE